MVAEIGDPVTIPTMIFNRREGCSFSFRHDNLMVIELKVTSALMHKILIDARSSADIITSLNTPGGTLDPRCIRSWASALMPIGVIRLPLWFWNKTKWRNLEVDLVVVMHPHPTMSSWGSQPCTKFKVIIASYLLKIQNEADDGSIKKLFGDQ
ncbi:LOW QUALITY PROTEIN: hypothetical protein Cgig2_001081 [Carnegiea gigantea]|uniref:Uncharacterized protein n=1 Tax=Carnegiea gigantea TaxID=171969 RepID=A0A9Q1K6G7_9CARY|nr:LOW QUALITY PROTEIN: hypothetical protein Cgig2_001081 [Carnegiea gigantea]